MGQGSFGTVRLGLNLDTGELIAVKQVELGALGASNPSKAVTEVEEVKSLMQVSSLFCFSRLACADPCAPGNRSLEDYGE